MDITPIDLGNYQRTIMEAIHNDEGLLARLRRDMELVTARLQGNRGKLDLLAELSQAGAQTTEGTAEE